jgi:hypothetical protein
MAVPSVISTRRFSAPTRLRLQLAFARAWEALAETYQLQAAEFVRRLRSRLSVDEALDRYFREVGVPAPIEETVRSRALISLSGLIENTPRRNRQGASWSMLRPDQLVDALRRRMEYVESTNLECRLAASVSDEAVAASHVRSALQTAEVLYVRTFNLSAIDGQVIYRKAMAQWAELHPLPDEGEAFIKDSALPVPTVARQRLDARTRPEFGLRVMV